MASDFFICHYNTKEQTSLHHTHGGLFILWKTSEAQAV